MLIKNTCNLHLLYSCLLVGLMSCTDSQQEDLGALFFDADVDGDPDLYVVSGGNEFPEKSPLLQDRLYINDGKGNFEKTASLPAMASSGSCVIPADYDGDGDPDLFVGGRLVPGKYPVPANSHILRNDKGKFRNVTQEVAPDLTALGLVTDAVWTDFDGDEKIDLMIVGEWMPVTCLKNEGDRFVNVTADFALEDQTGWWYSVEAADFDKDGDEDYILGNLGLNYKYKASVEEPFHIYANDFDGNGTFDIVLGYYDEGTLYPLRGRECSSQQMPFIKEKFPDYNSFAVADLNKVYGFEALDQSVHYEANTFASFYLENQGSGRFAFRRLPMLAQFSSINDMLIRDFDQDQHLDVLIAGNLYAAEVETPRNDASIGLLLKGDGKGGFQPVSVTESGFYTPVDVKDIDMVSTANGDLILVAANNDRMKVFKLNEGRHIAMSGK